MTQLEKLQQWSFANALNYFYMNLECCASEFTQTTACRYDLERFGIRESLSAQEANVLVVAGPITEATLNPIKAVLENMSQPRWIVSIGSCACSGAPFNTTPLEKVAPVDIFIPGCPPRPEAIMNGFLKLQEKILKKERDQ